MRTLVESWERGSGVVDERARRATDVILQRWDVDRHRYSEVFEASVSWDAAGAHAYRYSYAFPGFRREVEPVLAVARSFAEPFGAAAASSLLKLFGLAARHRAIELPLLGLAIDEPTEPRLKVYLQFRDGEDDAPWALAESILTTQLATVRAGGRSLHMLGLDFSPAGLSGAKLYTVVRRLRLPGDFGAIPLFESLSGTNPELSSVLAIHRIGAPDDPGLARPSEIDFGLAENELTWPALRREPALAAAADGAFARLEQDFKIAVRRISLGIGPLPKLNVYYVLCERDDAGFSDPVAGLPPPAFG